MSIEIENVETYGWEAAIRGMRNPMNSWDKSDSVLCPRCINAGIDCPRNDMECEYRGYCVGDNDLALMKKLAKAGTDHRKFMRMITVTMDITAPDYWFKEFSTYRIGVTENSTSTMHRIQAKEFTLDDFSTEHLNGESMWVLGNTIKILNQNRENFNRYNDKDFWWQMIQLLPMSYNYRRTVCLNYEVLANMYKSRKNHKLDEWREFCKFIETLPYAELITGEYEI